MKNPSPLHRIHLSSAVVIAGALTAIVASAHSGGIATTLAAHFVQVGTVRSFESTPRVHQWTFEARRGPSPFDRIGLRRLHRGLKPPVKPAIVVLYLPGTNMNGEVAIDNARYSLPLYMAAHGVDFWSFDYRTHFIPPDTPSARLGELRGWTDAVFESDIDAAVRFIIATTGRRRIFLSGFSRGVSFAYLYAAQHPQNVEGLLLFDGWIPHRVAGTPPPGRIVDDIGGKHLTYQLRRALLEDVIRNPNGPAPLRKYRNAADNLAHVLYDSASFGGHGGLANALGGFSDPAVLARQLTIFDRYWPAVQDYEAPFTPARMKTLGSSRIPVMAFSSTNISPQWPKQVARSAHATGSSDVRVISLRGWGHLDVICGSYAERAVFAPALAWLKRRRKLADNPDWPGPDWRRVA
ncbi:MAG: alpha/beta hydrolase [Candidatus Binataceae bacterium]